jgi:outer membrane receptor for ferric coprogen and ferric-rhodotorulic acid
MINFSFPLVRRVRPFRVLGLVLALAGAALLHAAEEAARKTFFLPVGSAEQTLKQFAEQAGRGVVFVVTAVKDVRTNAVQGELAPADALRQMLAGTPLVAEEDAKTGAFAVRKGAADPNGGRAARSNPPSRRPDVSLAALEPGEETIQLSPFEVTTDKDLGYAASAAMSATRTNEKLENLPNSISVMTQEFMQDLALNNYFDAVEFATDAENIVNAQGVTGAMVGNRSGNQINVRGLATVRQLRDGFPWYMAADVFNTERIEMSRGPGGLAYGDVDASGIVNIVTKRAGYQRKGAVQVRYDDFGTQRYSLDFNQPLAERLAARFNAIRSEVEQRKQRRERRLEGFAGALRWEPFKDHRTQFDATFEMGRNSVGLSHLRLTDNRIAYVPGTGTNALDANPNLAGTQTNGIGMKRIQAAGNNHAMADIRGVIYNLQSTATTVYRMSATIETAAAVSATDPQNPRLLPLLSTPTSIIPENEDWGGPDNRQDSTHHAYLLELKHSFRSGLNLLLAFSGQRDDQLRKQSIAANPATLGGATGRTVVADVNRVLPDPNGSGTIPNPNFEKLYTLFTPFLVKDGHDIANWRGQLVYDARLPWGISQRVALNANYRHEKVYIDYFGYSLTAEEIARRGFTGAAAYFTNNMVYPIHYLEDGNSDQALGWNERPGLTRLFRTGPESNRRLDQSLTSGSVNLLGRYFNGRVRTSLGLSRDRWRQSVSDPLVRDPVTYELRFVGADGSLLPNHGTDAVTAPTKPFANEWTTNQTFGGVWHVFPWVSLAAGYFESSQFSDNYGIDLNGEPFPPLSGEGTDYSLRFHLAGGRIEASVTRFSTTQENINSAIDTVARDELTPLLRTPFVNVIDYRDSTATGWEFEVVANLRPNWTLKAAYGRNGTAYTRFFPLLEERLTEARATARSRGLDPDAATVLTREFLDEQKSVTESAKRITASLVTRYSFVRGPAKGLAVGLAARFVSGRPWTPVIVGGTEVLPATTTEDYLITSPFFTYRRRFGRLAWSLQVNVDNVFNVRTNQAGSYRWPRYIDPRKFTYTTTIGF